MPQLFAANAKLAELKIGQQARFYAHLIEKLQGKTRDLKPFFTCRFRDKRRSVSLVLWSDSEWFDRCLNTWKIGQFFQLLATIHEHEKYGLQLELRDIRPIEKWDEEEGGFSLQDFIDHSRFDPNQLYDQIMQLIETEIGDAKLKQLLQTIYQSYEAILKQLPANLRNYYPFRGGWLEHTLSTTKTCMLLHLQYLERYPDWPPPLNRDVLLAAALLHEIGRVKEIDITENVDEPFQLSLTGRLVGFHFLTRDIVRDAVLKIEEFDPALYQLLEHVLLSYLALPEWGSPRLPMVPEALILHHADDLDAKMEMYYRCLSRDMSEGPLTERDPVLSKPLWKGRQI